MFQTPNNKRRQFCAHVGLIWVGAGLLCTAGWGQEPSQAVGEFEVASIHIHDVSKPTTAKPGLSVMGDRVTVGSATPYNLILTAYNLRPYQIVGGPKWIDSWQDASYDIDALAPTSVTESEARLMLRALLRERFRLRVHEEDREMAIFNLRVYSKGHKLEESSAQEVFSSRTGPAAENRRYGLEMTSIGVTTGQLAATLLAYTQRPIVDRTGLLGRFNIKLKWFQAGAGGGLDQDFGGLPSLSTALEEQLGLILEPAKALIPVLVVDSIERPSEN